MPVRSGWLSPDSQSREDTRLVAFGALTPVSPVATRSGVLPGSADGQTRLSGFTAEGIANSMSVTVHPGRALVQGLDAQGAYPVALTEDLTLTFADGDAQYDRIDLVVLRIYDDFHDGSGRTEAAVEIVQGTPAAVPAVPATPALAIPLYQAAISKGSSAAQAPAWNQTLTGMRTTTVALGGILPVTTDTTGGAYPGQYRDLGGVLQRWTGTAWADYQSPVAVETTTTGATATTDWTLTSYSARRTHGMCSFTLALTRSGADLTATAAGTTNPGNVSDQLIATLPEGWRPTGETIAAASDGYADGSVRILADGSVYLITWSTSGVIQTGHNLRLSACYVL
ncbi:hypothetical protein [Streptomyces malaysiense]|uniref:Uncharacterized protein n=1 Tax=Streptomyces malaysiense TaxID=1428626 RepID=A0A1J4Q161_9ACTN|nr:hypothetical protein [Streptomyces malaysiense]OIK25864.1 hypothetical protein VT52_019265 [Streptomyces malaysiense]